MLRLPPSVPGLLVAGMLLASGTAARAQTPSVASISGRVTDAASEAGLADVHVFVASSTAGTVTDADGSFRLERVPLGAIRLVVSRVGYAVETEDVMVRRPVPLRMDFGLEPRVLRIPEVVVTGERELDRPRRMERFARLFLGETENARATRILNPDVLSFDTDGDTLLVRAAAPLEIENRALGYRIRYELYDFAATGSETRQDGAALFEELDPVDEAQWREWQGRRAQAYLGSLRHFLRSLVLNETGGSGFFVYRADRPRPASTAGLPPSIRATGDRSVEYALRPADLVSIGPSEREFILRFPDFIEIVYTRERDSAVYRRWQRLPTEGPPDYQRSWITLRRDRVIVDREGALLDPYAMSVQGFMAFERLADLVPREFGPVD